MILLITIVVASSVDSLARLCLSTLHCPLNSILNKRVESRWFGCASCLHLRSVVITIYHLPDTRYQIPAISRIHSHPRLLRRVHTQPNSWNSDSDGILVTVNLAPLCLRQLVFHHLGRLGARIHHELASHYLSFSRSHSSSISSILPSVCSRCRFDDQFQTSSHKRC